MRRTTFVLLSAVLLCALAAPTDASDAAVCTWGGTYGSATGTFQLSPGLRTEPAGVPIEFTVTGPLAGVSPRCTGTMTVTGFDIPGSRCAFGIGHARVEGVDGLATAFTTGALHANHQTLFDAAGRIAGQADVEVASTGIVEARTACSSPEGVVSGRFSGVLTLYPVAA